MNDARANRTAGTRRTGRARWASALLLGLALSTGTAAADCDDCEAPTGEELQALAGFTLEERDGERDYVETDGGECSFVLRPPPRYSIVREWWVLRGSGMVWDCPHSNSCDSIVAEASEEDSTEWSSTSGASGSVSIFGFSIGSSLLQAVSEGFRVRTVTRVEKNICANWCHRIPWDAYFHVAEYRGEIDWAVERRFAWWTKNDETGATVHQSGSVQVECLSGTAAFGRLAPIDVAVHLFDEGCPDSELCAGITPQDLGFFPPLERESPPPVVVTPSEPAPPESEEPAPTLAPEEETPPASEPSDPYDLGEPPAGASPVPPGFEEESDLPFYETGPSTEEPWIVYEEDGTPEEVVK